MKILNQLIQYYQHRRPLHHTGLRSILLVTSILTLIFCRKISEYTSEGDINMWFYHFTVVERASMLLLLLSVLKEVKKFSWVLGELFLIFLTQDIIDRVIFNSKEININDYITIGLLLIIALIKYTNKKWQQHNKK